MLTGVPGLPEGACPCYACLDDPTKGFDNPATRYMVLCPRCGNKRCPHAAHHVNACTDSNEPGQVATPGVAHATIEEPLAAHHPTSGTWVGDAEALIAMGARPIDTATVRGLLVRVRELEECLTGARKEADMLHLRALGLERGLREARDAASRDIDINECDCGRLAMHCDGCLATVRTQQVDAATMRATEAETAFAACAHAAGIEYVPDTGASAPGPVEAVVKAIGEGRGAIAKLIELDADGAKVLERLEAIVGSLDEEDVTQPPSGPCLFTEDDLRRLSEEES